MVVRHWLIISIGKRRKRIRSVICNESEANSGSDCAAGTNEDTGTGVYAGGGGEPSC